MRAGDVIAALVGQFELPLDPAEALDRGRRGQEDFLAVAKAVGAGLGQRHRIALALKVARIGIDLVQKEPARRHGPKADG